MSYRLEKVTIREYRSIKYLSLSEAGEVIEISDVGDVVSDGEEEDEYVQNVAVG